MDISRRLAEFIVGTEYTDFSPEVIHGFKRALLDYLSVTITGSQMGTSKKVLHYLKSIDRSQHSCVIGTKTRLSPLNAAFANGTSCHALDFDDGYTRGSVHPAGSCISSVFAVAEQVNAVPCDFLSAVIIAYDVTLRISGQVHPWAAKRGFHNTATVGVFGAAAGVSSLLGLSVEQTVNALGLAGSFSGGTREFLPSQGEEVENKRIHPGKAARDGLLSAELACRGITGPATILEGKYGFFPCFAGIDLDPEAFFNGLGEIYGITDVYFKPYPVCRHLHGTIEAIIHLKEEFQIEPHEIEKILVELYEIGVHGHDHHYCGSLLSAQMNHPCVAALAAFYSEVSLQNLKFGFTAEVKELMERVEVVVSQECEERYPRQRPVVVTMKKKDGVEVKKQLLDLKGEAQKPLSDKELVAKFYGNCLPIIGKQKCERILEAVWQFEKIESLEEFYHW